MWSPDLAFLKRKISGIKANCKLGEVRYFNSRVKELYRLEKIYIGHMLDIHRSESRFPNSLLANLNNEIEFLH